MMRAARQVPKQISRSNLPALLIGTVLAMAVPFGSYAADVTTSDSAGNPVSGEPEWHATPRPPMARAPRRHHSQGEIIGANVRHLAHGLELDSAQQIKLRGILVEHYQALTKLRTDAGPNTDRSGAMHAIVDRTRERIRAILNEAQKQKYSTDVSTQLAGATRADLEHWLDARDAAAMKAPQPPAKVN